MKQVNIHDMFFKTIILYTIVNVSSLLFISYFLSGFKISQSDGGYFIGLAIVLAIINYLLDPLIKFFTVKVRFVTIWLFGFLLTLPFLYVANLIVTGIRIQSGTFKSLSFGNIQFTSFEMSEIAVILVASLIIGFGYALIRWLRE